MTEILLAGDHRSALSHLVPIGLSSILRDQGDRSARSWWDTGAARPHLRTALSKDEVAVALIEHAAHRTEGAWLDAKIVGSPRDGMSLFSPRIKAASWGEWPEYVRQRDAWLEDYGHTLTPLDRRMLAALGQPAWWRCDERDARPDEGASRWEMKTRNRGEEFLAHRLVPLTRLVARRSATAVLAGLTGDAREDELGRGSPDSRTSTGLTVPGPVDLALAYAALWGLSALRVVHRKAGVSASVGIGARRGLHPTRAYLPVFVEPVTPAHLAAVGASRAFDEAGRRAAGLSDQASGSGEEAWLRQQGVHGLAVFPVLKTGSGNAPERQILSGELIIL